MSIKDYNTLGVLCALAVKYKIIYWKCTSKPVSDAVIFFFET